MPRDVVIGEEFGAFVDAQVESGRYGSATEVTEAALRLLMERDGEEATRLRRLVEQGRASGLSQEDPEAFFDRLEQQYGLELARQPAR